jgi:hypothetical protein
VAELFRLLIWGCRLLGVGVFMGLVGCQRVARVLLGRALTWWLLLLLACAFVVTQEAFWRMAEGSLWYFWFGMMAWSKIGLGKSAEGIHRTFQQGGHLLLLVFRTIWREGEAAWGRGWVDHL